MQRDDRYQTEKEQEHRQSSVNASQNRYDNKKKQQKLTFLEKTTGE